jgi:putative N6-adenine-specific DNA methylase
MKPEINLNSKIIITCSNRLSSYLQHEIEELGYTPKRVFKTGVELIGNINDCIKLNLHLRCASQVLFSLHTFQANNAEELYENIFLMEWEKLFSLQTKFSVTCNVHHPSINNELFANVKVKDAIVDRFRFKTGERPDSGADLTGVVIHLYWNESGAEVFIDTSGETLSKHGYRKIPGKAPMLEALASATILASKWDRNSTFINPMCGSGTLAIEALMIATKRKPGLYRTNYSFMHLTDFDAKFYKKEMAIIEANIVSLSIKIIATDIDENAIKNAKANAAYANIDALIDFEVCDFELTNIPENNRGVLFINPEYGERLGNLDELEKTYSRIGDFMKKKCGGYWGYIFTGNLDLAKHIGLKPSKRIEFYNSTIDCRLFEYVLYAGTKRIEKPRTYTV